MDDTEQIDAVALVRRVDQLRPFVVSRMYGFRGEVDNVLQEARIRVWELAGRYDERRGTPEAFVMGVVKMVVKHELGVLSKRQPVLELIETDQVLPSVLTSLVEEHETTAWIRLRHFVADAASSSEWDAMVELARHSHLSERGGRLPAAAEALGVSVRQLRAMRDRVRTLWRAALRASDALDAGTTPNPRWCVPDEGALRGALAHLEDPTSEGATALGISEGAFRTNRAFLVRILGMIEEIAAQAHPHSAHRLNAS